MVDFLGVLEIFYNEMLLVSLGELRPPQAPLPLLRRTHGGGNAALPR